MRGLSVIGGVVLLASALLAQGGASVGLAPAPVWPPDGNVPPELKDNSIFFRPETSELVVIPDAAGPAASPITFQLRNRAVPTVASAVKRDASGGYVYEYRIGASGKSRGPLQQWSLLVPAEDPKLVAGAPARWNAQQENTDMVDRPAPKHLLLKYIHFNAVAGAEVAAGGSVPGFRVVSSNLPGYVTSFARSKASNPFSPAALKGVSKALFDRVAAAASPEWDAQLRLVVGPRYLPQTETLMIATGFQYALEHFSARGELQEDSPFVKGAMASISAYVQNRSTGPFQPGQLQFLSAAQTPLEKEMAEAMAISLTAGK